ncbi:unnamed protein product [Phyllotreta striolata]|uniref:MADF domain-containing protein n=1 Tax=Phyllotreta striolata TaxID=444603 RepID=A0A9N9TQK9_PHYSR|nr:unnamed protein product [Phyllotreta striolata]
MLIGVMEQKPLLWDTSCEDYKNRDMKTKAWEDVCEMCIEQQDFRSLPEYKQQEAIKLIQQRWKSARDAYRRDQSKIKSGLDDSSFKKYIYFDNLKFLDKIPFNHTEVKFNKMDNEYEEEDEEVELSGHFNDGTVIEDIAELTERDIIHSQRKMDTRKRKKEVTIDERLMDLLESSKKSDPNGNRAFLESLIPTLDTFDEVKQLQFRAERNALLS